MHIGVQGKTLVELERLLKLFEAGELSGALTVARLLLVSRDVGSIERWLVERFAPDTRVQRELLNLIEQHRHGCQCVAALRERHVAPAGGERALAAAPVPVSSGGARGLDGIGRREASASAAVECFSEWGLLGAEQRTLELGCRNGRMQAALANRVRLAAGVDASPELVARARWCCSRLSNTRHEVAQTADLSVFDGTSFHLVYALDVDATQPLFPSGTQNDDRVTSIFAEVARVLRPSGHFVLFAPAPSADVSAGAVASALTPPQSGPAAHCIKQLARAYGFDVVAYGERCLHMQDWVSHRLRRRA